MSTYKSDPIVAEIRAIRAKQAARFKTIPQRSSGMLRHCKRHPGGITSGMPLVV